MTQWSTHDAATQGNCLRNVRHVIQSITILQLRAATQGNWAKSLRQRTKRFTIKEFSAVTQQKQAKNLRRDSKQHYFDMRRAATQGNQLKDLRRNSVKNIATHVEDMPPPARGCHSAVRRSGGGLRNVWLYFYSCAIISSISDDLIGKR